MDDPRALKLFKELLSKTIAGRLGWESTASEYEYIAALPGGLTVAVYEERMGTGEVPHTIAHAMVLRGPEGDLLTISADTDGVWPSEIDKLYELAKRQALHLDVKVDKLLGELAKM
jgi:hypothetical protein